MEVESIPWLFRVAGLLGGGGCCDVLQTGREMEHINAISKGEGEVAEFSAVLETCPLNEVIIKCQFPKATIYF